jgi:hypothetical protein
MVTSRVSCNFAIRQSMVSLQVVISCSIRLSKLSRKLWLKRPGDTLCMAQAKCDVTLTEIHQ